MAVSGQHMIDCTRCGEWPLAERAARAIEAKYWVLHAVDSEAFKMSADPVKSVDIKGEMKL